MKERVIRDRIFKTFSGYIVIILIPLIVLLYQGTVSITRNRNDYEENLIKRLEEVAGDVTIDLARTWEMLLDQENRRPFYHYHPLVVPDEAEFITTGNGSAVQRSPLYHTISNLRHLIDKEKGEARSADGSESKVSGDPRTVFDNSFVGYFQFDPHTQRMSTPYDASQVFSTSPEQRADVQRFQSFLAEWLLPELTDHLELDATKPPNYSDILRYIKAKRRAKLAEPTSLMVTELLAPDVLANASGNGATPWIDVNYYQFSFLNLAIEEAEYLVGIRAVLLDNHLVIQGFLFNLFLFLQETQVYLEPLQPEYGNIVIAEGVLRDQSSLFEPFNALAVSIRPPEGDDYLAWYYRERNRFWFTVICLVTALGASLIHLGKLIHAQTFLTRKKNDFVSAITHELKAPLTSIMMYTEMLREGWAKGKESIYYRYIHCESERLSRLIKNVLDYSGIERGVFRLNKSSLLLHEFVEESLEPLRVWFESNQLKLEFDVRATPFIRFDRDSLAQVIYNLCDNAIKYGKGQDGHTHLTMVIDENDHQASLTVFDHGPGVPKEDETKVFKRFYRCENELTRESTGTGLGLSLVKELIESNGGQIQTYHPDQKSGFGVRIFFPKMIDASLVA